MMNSLVAPAPRIVPTKEQWEQIGVALSSPYGSATLQVDGYTLDLQVSRLKGLRYTIVAFVNGAWNGTMLTTDCEERRRFFRPVNTCYMTPKTYASWHKMFGKRRADKEREGAKTRYFMPDWTSFTALRRHLLANNESIELVKAFP